MLDLWSSLCSHRVVAHAPTTTHLQEPKALLMCSQPSVSDKDQCLQVLSLFGAEPAASGKLPPCAVELGPPEARHRRELFAGLADAIALVPQPEHAPALALPPPEVRLCYRAARKSVYTTST